VNNWSEIFLGIIAMATLATAIAQVGIVLAAVVATRRLSKFVGYVEHELKPLFGHVNAIGRDAARAAQLATAQVERADRLFNDLIIRIEQAVASLQASVAGPAREGRALVAAIRAGFRAVQDARRDGRGRSSRNEDEDALFI
jgi:archaellum biogenesis protein FlaJ (TadC family)